MHFCGFKTCENSVRRQTLNQVVNYIETEPFSERTELLKNCHKNENVFRFQFSKFKNIIDLFVALYCLCINKITNCTMWNSASLCNTKVSL